MILLDWREETAAPCAPYVCSDQTAGSPPPARPARALPVPTQPNKLESVLTRLPVNQSFRVVMQIYKNIFILSRQQGQSRVVSLCGRGCLKIVIAQLLQLSVLLVKSEKLTQSQE